MVNFQMSKAQTTIEYALIVACIVAALLGMQHYIKRAAQGRLRETADSIGGQYDPRYLDSQITFTQSGVTTTVVEMVRQDDEKAESGMIDGISTITTTTDELSSRTGYEHLEVYPSGLFD